jgi:hypothetical protein
MRGYYVKGRYVVDRNGDHQHCCGADTPAARAGVSRALRRLQEMGLIRGGRGGPTPYGTPREKGKTAQGHGYELTKRGTKRFGLNYSE